MSVPTQASLIPAVSPPRDTFLFVEHLVREHRVLSASILAGHGDEVRGRLVVTAVTGAALFGLAVGMPGGVVQALLSAVKFPVVLLLSAGASLPVLYVGTGLAGRSIPYRNLSALVLQGVATAAVSMAALAPLVVVGWLTLSLLSGVEWWVYRRLMLLSLVICVLGGLAGARPLMDNLPASAAAPWTLAFGLVGLQFTWLLRPIIGNPAADHVVLLRPLESSGLREALEAIAAVLF